MRYVLASFAIGWVCVGAHSFSNGGPLILYGLGSAMLGACALKMLELEKSL